MDPMCFEHFYPLPNPLACTPNSNLGMEWIVPLKAPGQITGFNDIKSFFWYSGAFRLNLSG